MRPIVAVLMSLTFVSFATTAVFAGAPRTHDGFFLRLSAGLGSAGTSIDDEDEEIEIHGLAGDGNFAIGGVVANNLALHGTFWGWSADEPDVEFNDVEVGDLDGSASVSAVGPGVTYYIMPANLYLSGAVGIAWLSFDEDAFDADTDTGFALDATIGKEWWVGNNWGLGLAGTVGYHSIPADFIDESFSGVSLGLRFSATLN